MPQATRIVWNDDPTVYHVISRASLGGFPLDGPDKDYLLRMLKQLAAIYFVDIFGFCLMGDHFHLLLRVHPAATVTDAALLERFQAVFGRETRPSPERLEQYRSKWTSLMEFVRELKQSFTRHYNREHGRKGFFWSQRYRSLIVEEGLALMSCLAYIDLNPVRAGIAEHPEEYRWCTSGYHAQTGNAGGLLSLDFGPEDWDGTEDDRLRRYREFLDGTGALGLDKDELDERKQARAGEKGFEYTHTDRFSMRTRWFVRGEILGSHDFVLEMARKLDLPGADKRKPKKIPGLDGLYSFRQLGELL